MADQDQDMEPRSSPAEDAARSEEGGDFSPTLRPVFLGNLTGQFQAADIRDIFERPHQPDSPEAPFDPVSVERVDLKRGYCFVFLHDATSEEHKKRIQTFVHVINGMSVPNVSNALRSEFARGDGRIKRKEDDRRRKIQPSETLFVVNFHEETTKREDLQMLFEPFGELVRIDMKKNYAFVQFRTIEEATRAKEVTNGGKLDQSVLTVEYVARQRSGDGGGGGGNDGRRGNRDRDRRRGGGGGNDRGGGYDRRGPPPQAPDRYRRDDYRRRSPPRHRRGSRSRSRSPPRYRSRSPPRRRSRSPSPGYYRRDRDYRGGDRLPPPRGGPDDGEYYRRDDYRGDRGYR